MSPRAARPPLEQHPCQSRCEWLPDGSSRLTCEGCGSEWDSTQAWSPLDLDGSVPPAAQELRDRRDRMGG